MMNSVAVPAPRSREAAMSRRNWVRVRDSSGPCSPRAVAVVFEPVVFGAELCEVAGGGVSAVFPGLEVVGFVVGGVVGAAGEGAFGVAHPDPAFDGLR